MPLELPPVRELFSSVYKAFIDPSGGVGQTPTRLPSATRTASNSCSIWSEAPQGKFDPHKVTEEYAELVKQYGVGTVVGDTYAAQWVAGAWLQDQRHLRATDIPKSKSIGNAFRCSPAAWSDCPTIPRCCVSCDCWSAQRHRGGEESIDHPRGAA